MTTLHTLASGSSGNAALLSCGGAHLLLDAGISCRRITTALKELDLTAADLTAVCITHTHSDHISGLKTLLGKTDAPIYATPKAAIDLARRLPDADGRLLSLDYGETVEVGGCTITAVRTSHDAPGACGYRVDTAGGSVALLTDTGYVTPEAEDLLTGADLAVLEANHDVEALCSGPYPDYLKERVLGPMGHLRNEDAAQFAVALAESGTSEIVLAHLSQENNTPAQALRAVETALSAAGLAPAVSVAPRDTLSAPYTVARRTVCRR